MMIMNLKKTSQILGGGGGAKDSPCLPRNAYTRIFAGMEKSYAPTHCVIDNQVDFQVWGIPLSFLSMKACICIVHFVPITQ